MSEPLSKDEKRFLQEVIGTFLYYAQVVDATMLPAEQTMERVRQLLDYTATHPDTIITYRSNAKPY